MSWAWAFGFAFFFMVGRAAYIGIRSAVDGWRDAVHLAAHLAVHVVIIAVGAKGLDAFTRREPSVDFGPPSYAVEVSAPAAPVVVPIASAPWASAANPLGDSVAAVDGLCDALQRERADLYADWRPVCLEIAARAPAYGVRPSLALAVAWHESRLNPHVIGALGEVGPLQVRPEMHCGGECADPIGAGLVVLARYVGRHGEADGMCRYRGAPAGCQSPRVALADAIEGE